MKNLFISAVLTVLLYTFLVEATSEPVCHYEPTGEAIRRNHEVIHFKPDTGCERRVSCNPDFTAKVEECSPVLCPADKALEKDVFPDCCCL